MKLSKKDLLVIIFSFLLSAMFYMAFYLSGHYLILADNLIQNLPLRYLSGVILRTGHLPEIDLYDFSGFPLLADFNSGALYPTTLLFWIFPPLLAFTFNQITASYLGFIGMYLLLRKYKLSYLPSVVGALIFVTTGQMASQVGHIDIVQAAGIYPWTLLSMEFLADSLSKNSRAIMFLSVIFFGLTIALILLTGSTRESTDILIIIFIRFLYLSAAHLPHGFKSNIKELMSVKIVKKLLVFIILGLLISLAIASVEILPGFATLMSSQRGNTSIAFFTESSPFIQWIFVLINPIFLGTTGSFNSPTFYGAYQIPYFNELGGYMSFFSILATTYFFQSKKKLTNKPSFINFYLALVLTGIALTFLSSVFPFNQFFYHTPIYGKERIQARNIIITDIALPVLAATYLDQMINPGYLKQAICPLRVKMIFLFSLIFNTVGLIYPRAYLVIFDSNNSYSAGSSGLRPWYGALLLIEIITFFLIYKLQIKNHIKLALLLVVVLLDILFYNLGAVATLFQTTNTNHFDTTSVAAKVISRATTNSNRISNLNKTLIWDPNLYHNSELPRLGWPDINIFLNRLSAQGYASLVNSRYQHFSYTHGNLVFSPKALQEGNFNILGVSTLYCSDDAFANPGAITKLPGGLPVSQLAQPPNPNDPASFYVGADMIVSEFKVKTLNSAAMNNKHFNFYALLEDSQQLKLTSYHIDQNNYVDFKIPSPQRVVGFFSNLSWKQLGWLPDSGEIILQNGNLYYLNGLLQDVVKIPKFTYEGVVDGFLKFHVNSSQHLIAFDKKVALVNTVNLYQFGKLTFNVKTPTNNKVYIAFQNIPGWHVKIISKTENKELTIFPNNPIITFNLPKGTWLVDLYYSDPLVKIGLVISIIALTITLVISFALIMLVLKAKNSN